MAQLILGHGLGMIDLVSQHAEGDLLQLLHAQQRVQLGLGLGETLVVLGVDEEDDAVDFREVVLPETAGLLMAAQIECREANVADGELLGGCNDVWSAGAEDTCRGRDWERGALTRVEGGLEDGDTVVL